MKNYNVIMRNLINVTSRMERKLSSAIFRWTQTLRSTRRTQSLLSIQQSISTPRH